MQATHSPGGGGLQQDGYSWHSMPSSGEKLSAERSQSHMNPPVPGQARLHPSTDRPQNYSKSAYTSGNPSQAFGGRSEIGHSIPIFEANLAPPGGNIRAKYPPPIRQQFKSQPRQHSIRGSPPASKPGQIQITGGPSRMGLNPGTPRSPTGGSVQYYLSSRAKAKRKPDKFFACNFCGKMFTSHMGLYFHKPIHTGEWKYKCAVCQRGFQETKKYNKHVESHRKKLQIQI